MMKKLPLLAAAGGLALLSCAQVAAATALDYQPVPGVWPEPKDSADCCPSLADFVGRVMDEQLRQESFIPGAAVVIVRNGEPLYLGGFGSADREGNIPVNAERTLFRIGSISKLFAWTAVMQLAERGLVDLSADVNAYLGDASVPATFPGPVTLKNLMTHTAGFEPNTFGYTLSRGCCALPRLADTVARRMPGRVHPPVIDFTKGETAIYSNFAAALAGHIVARQSKQLFEQYVETHIFDPLEMTRSTFREPVPAPLDADVSQSYVVWPTPEDAPVYDAVPFEYYHAIGPAGSASATAADMAHFMIAHLQKGRYRDRRILKDETAEAMHGRRFGPHPQVNGSGYGFMEKYINGRRVLWHDGQTIAFHSELYLLPDENVGLFVAYNSDPPGDLLGSLMQRFMDEYFPAHIPPLQPRPDAAARAAVHAGTYGSVAHSYTTWEKRFALNATYQVEATSKGLRIENYPAHGLTTDWIEVPAKPGVYRREDRGESLAFSQGSDGRTYLLGELPFAPMVRLRTYETPQFDQAFVATCVLAFLIGAIITAFPAGAGRVCALVRWLAALVAAIDLGILECLRRTSGWDVYEMLVALPWPVTAVMWLACASALLTPLLLLAAVIDGWRSSWGLPARLGYLAMLLAALAFVWWLDFWNLVGFRIA